MIKATPAKLKDGTWGARVRDKAVAVGDVVHITTSTGKEWDAVIKRVVWEGDGVTIVATESLDRSPARGQVNRGAQPDADEPLAGVRGGARRDAGRNRRPGYCDRCGEYLRVGEGHLEFCMADSGCMMHFDEDGYHLYCADSAACSARAAVRREEDKSKKAALTAAYDGLVAVAGMMQPIDATPEWANDAHLIATWAQPAMPHTAAYQKLYVTDGKIYSRTPGYFACDYDYPAVEVAGDISAEQMAQVKMAIEAAKAVGLVT